MESPAIEIQPVTLTKEDFLAGKHFYIDGPEAVLFKSGCELCVSYGHSNDGMYHSAIWRVEDDGFVLMKWPFENVKIDFSRCTLTSNI